MMNSTFSTFDMMLTPRFTPMMSLAFGLMPLLMLSQLYWITPPTRLILLTFVSKLVCHRVQPTLGSYSKGFSYMLTPTFSSIIILNMWGTAPYSITLTSHLMVTMSMGVILWLTLLTIATSTGLKPMSAHLLPENTPPPISWFLSLVETLSSYIRPITLSFRLAANISAGHVILGMMISAAAFAILSNSWGMPILLMSSAYLMFELMICFIQAFVFTLLSIMYSNDYLPHIMHKLMH